MLLLVSLEPCHAVGATAAATAGPAGQREADAWKAQMLERVENSFEKAKNYFENKEYEKASEAVQEIAEAIARNTERLPEQLKHAAEALRTKIIELKAEVKEGNGEVWGKLQYYTEKLRYMLSVSYNFLLAQEDYRAGDGEGAAGRLEKIKAFMATVAKESGQGAEALWKLTVRRLDRLTDDVRNRTLRNIRKLQRTQHLISRQLEFEYRLSKAEVYIKDEEYHKAAHELRLAVMYLESGEELPRRLSAQAKEITAQLRQLITSLSKADKTAREYTEALRSIFSMVETPEPAGSARGGRKGG